MAKRLVGLTLPIVGHINASVEIDIPDGIQTEDEALQWIKENYTAHNIVRLDSFANDDIDYQIDTEDNDNLHCWRVDMEEEVA